MSKKVNKNDMHDPKSKPLIVLVHPFGQGSVEQSPEASEFDR